MHTVNDFNVSPKRAAMCFHKVQAHKKWRRRVHGAGLMWGRNHPTGQSSGEPHQKGEIHTTVHGHERLCTSDHKYFCDFLCSGLHVSRCRPCTAGRNAPP